MKLTHKTMRQKIDIDRMFIGELRTHTGPVTISLMSTEGGGKNYPASGQAVHV